MSNWIQVTNLPYYYDEKEVMDMFNDIGPIKRVEIEHVQLSLKTTALIQFVHTRNSRLAATRKDQTVVGNGVIRVRVVWCRKETLATVKVSNLPLNITDRELRDYFAPYGDIVDVRFNKIANANEAYDDKTDDSINNEVAACISFGRVDYALRACHEMHHSIISGCSDDSGLCVSLVNPDSRNLKWKRNLFEYVRCSVPSKRTKGGNHRAHKNSTNNKTLKSNISFSASTGYSPASVCRVNMNDKMTCPPLLNMPSVLPNTNINTVGSVVNWLPSMYDGGIAMNTHSGTSLISGGSDTSKNIGVAPCMNFNNINTFNNVDGNNVNVANMIPKLNMTDLLLQSSNSLQQSSGMFAQQHPNSAKSDSVSSTCMFGSATGMSPSAFTPLFLPNMFLTIPQNGSFVSPVSSSVSSGVTPLLSHGFPTPPLINSPSASSVLSLQQTHSQKTVSSTSSTVNSNADTITNTNHILSPKLTQSRVPSCGSLNSIVTNPIHTSPNFSTRLTSTPSPVGTKTNQPSDSPSFTSVTTFSDSVKEHVTGTDSSNVTPSQRSMSGSVCSISNDVILSPSIWSAKQREMGDIIYHELKSDFPERVAKLTGMLLSLPKEELSPLISERHKLKARAHQFVQLLNRNESL